MVSFNVKCLWCKLVPMNFVNPSDQTIRVGPLTIRFLITGGDSGGSVAAFEYTVPAGERLPVPAHSHDGYEETSYGVEGTLRFIVDGKEFEVGPGQAVCIPRGAFHRFENQGIVTPRGWR